MDSIKVSNKAIEKVKAEIDERLRVRCINVETTLEVVERNGRSRFILRSTKFNTVPVLHSPIEVVDFGGGIEAVKDGKDGDMSFWISVTASYEGNGVDLFRVSGLIAGEDVYIK